MDAQWGGAVRDNAWQEVEVDCEGSRMPSSGLCLSLVGSEGLTEFVSTTVT